MSLHWMLAAYQGLMCSLSDYPSAGTLSVSIPARRDLQLLRGSDSRVMTG